MAKMKITDREISENNKRVNLNMTIDEFKRLIEISSIHGIPHTVLAKRIVVQHIIEEYGELAISNVIPGTEQLDLFEFIPDTKRSKKGNNKNDKIKKQRTV